MTSSAPETAASLAEAVRQGLTSRPKTLPSRYFYDAAGSRLFEEICAQPEYYLTRVEHRILRDNAAEIVSCVPPDAALVELGSGSAEKTRRLIEAFLARHPELTFVPIDISRAALEASGSDLLDRHPGLDIRAVAADYEHGLEHVAQVDDRPHLILWLGSSVGNLLRDEAAAFLSKLRTRMRADDRLLIGIDLRKDPERLEAAYNDAAGVTARFNLNQLERINRELGGQFDAESFRFEAIYREQRGVVQSYLESRTRQRVRVEAFDLELEFDPGETIHTEDSYKYSTAEITSLARGAGLTPLERWCDEERLFSVTLLASNDS